MEVSGGLPNLITILVACPSGLCQLFFRFPASFVEPWCQSLSPFVGVAGVGLFNLFDYTRFYSFTNYIFLYCLCPLVIITFLILYYVFQLRYERCFLCVSCPYLRGLAVVGELRALYPFICNFFWGLLAWYWSAAMKIRYVHRCFYKDMVREAHECGGIVLYFAVILISHNKVNA
jgi:hypothetical protein